LETSEIKVIDKTIGKDLSIKIEENLLLILNTFPAFLSAFIP
jgi:hypothetical protein